MPNRIQSIGGLLLISVAVAFAVSVAAGCGTDDPPGSDSGVVADCVPSRVDWDATVGALVTTHCGACHGDTPDFGAPVTLTDYDALLVGVEGMRLVDRMVTQVAGGTMPPTGAPQPALSERDVIAEWASCGAVRVEDPVGLDANRPVYVSPADAPEGLEVIDLTAGGFAVSATEVDRYFERDFTALVTEDVFIRRFDAIVDDSRVLHHLTLRRAVGTSGVLQYLYAWAPGTGAFEFPEGGVRLSAGDRLVLQIHYNNGAAYEGVSDSSGVRLFVAPVAGPEYMMADPGPGTAGFSIPARGSSTAEQSCIVREPVRILASMPHMHEIGASFELDRVRGGRSENLLRLGGWDFETQLFYDLPIDLAVDDELVVRCTYDNPSDTDVSAGFRTEDEMCFAFTYVTPPNAGFCSPVAGDLVYAPGECVGDPVDVSTLAAVVTEDAPVFDATGVIPDGRWAATRAVMATDNVIVASIAEFSAAGQLASAAGSVEGDASFHVIAPVDPLRAGVQSDITFTGTLDEAAGPSALTTTCGDAAGTRFGTVAGVPAIAVPIPAGDAMIDLELWVFFDPS
ncbi:MAG: hypothetical protein DRJ42_11605 [Deltaproteobacteria bacterium]|nr:MAG: hypothetical protein DRJ42_11605 [Deltaproteobacteria bacterium]